MDDNMIKVTATTVTGAHKDINVKGWWWADVVHTLEDGRTVTHSLGRYSRKRDALAAGSESGTIMVELSADGSKVVRSKHVIGI
jgi:hypothetical protein